MKYIITENQMDQIILNYIEENYGDLSEWYGFDDEASQTECIIEFYRGDYYEHEDAFKVYEKCWWDPKAEKYSELIERSPVLIFDNEVDMVTLDGFFGERWKPIFKEWLFNKYNVKVKSFGV